MTQRNPKELALGAFFAGIILTGCYLITSHIDQRRIDAVQEALPVYAGKFDALATCEVENGRARVVVRLTSGQLPSELKLIQPSNPQVSYGGHYYRVATPVTESDIQGETGYVGCDYHDSHLKRVLLSSITKSGNLKWHASGQNSSYDLFYLRSSNILLLYDTRD